MSLNRKTGSPLTAGEAGAGLTSTATLVTGEGSESGTGLMLKNSWKVPTIGEYNYYDWAKAGEQGRTISPTQTITGEVHNIPYPLPNNIGGLITDNG